METHGIHRPHAKHDAGLPRWLELVIAVTALVTSISSIVIAVHDGRILGRLVQENSLPFLQGGFSDRAPDGDKVLSLDLFNRGVGPAHEWSLHVKVGDRYVRSLPELVSVSLGRDHALEAEKVFKPIENRMRTRFIPGGQSQSVFRLPRTSENAEWWDSLSAAEVEC